MVRRPPARRVLVPLLAPLLLAQCDSGSSGPPAQPNQAPVVSVDLVPSALARTGYPLEFLVTAFDPDGDRVALELLTPREGLLFAPRGFQPSPCVERVHWRVPAPFGEGAPLVFVARDEREPERGLRFVLPLSIEGGKSTPGVLQGDVTGDGRADLVAIAGGRDTGFGRDVGELYVFSAGGLDGAPALANLRLASAEDGDLLGNSAALVDLTGDGLLDVFSASFAWSSRGLSFDDGAAFLWPGGPALTGTVTPPLALAVEPEPDVGRMNARLLPDLSGDGLPDVLGWDEQLSPSRRRRGYLWIGGELGSPPAPGATLVLPASGTWTRGSDEQRLADVTGDGHADLVLWMPSASVGGISASGAVLVYAGGPTLRGAVEARALLAHPSARTADGLGGSNLRGVLSGDVTGDGIADLVAAAPRADTGTQVDAGALFVWQGGAALNGSPAPLASLRLDASRSELGQGTFGQGFELHDLDRDGTLDVVALARDAVAVWRGGPGLAGAPPPSDLLTAPLDPVDRLGAGLSFVPLLHFVDVFGDGTSAVGAGSPFLDVDGVVNAGAFFLWRTGPTLSGERGPTAMLAIPGASQRDGLGEVEGGDATSVWFGDVSGDGRDDVVLGASLADVEGSTDTGAVFVWSELDPDAPRPAPSARLTVPGRSANARLGHFGDTEGGLQLVDLTRDGVLDVLAGSSAAPQGQGALFVWRGGPALRGSPEPWSTLTSVASQSLGNSSRRNSLWLADLTGDGTSDLLVATVLTDFGGVFNSGGAFLWDGAALEGSPAPLASFARAQPEPLDNLGLCNRGAYRPLDLDDDGRLDLVLSGGEVDVGGVMDAGAILLWRGPLGAENGPPVELTAPDAREGDRLSR